jgi:hypothetical protein
MGHPFFCEVKSLFLKKHAQLTGKKEKMMTRRPLYPALGVF